MNFDVDAIQDGLQTQGVQLSPDAISYLGLMGGGQHTDNVSCWRLRDIQRQAGSKIERRGIFALKAIGANQLIAIKPGHLVNEQSVKDNIAILQHSQQQVGPDQFIIGLTSEEVDKNLVGYNHSCDPNAKVIILEGVPLGFLVTRRSVEAGEELAVDYAASIDSDTQCIDDCLCGSSLCRGTITPSRDWQRPELQDRYKGEFAYYIQTKIDRLK